MTDITNGKGAILSVTSSAQKVEIVPAPGTAGSQKSAVTLEISNDGAETIYCVVNCEVADYVQATAIPILVDKSICLIAQPIKKFVIASASGTVAASYYAY